MVQHDILDYRGRWLVLTFTTSDELRPLRAAGQGAGAAAEAGGGAERDDQPAGDRGHGATASPTENKITSPIVFDQSQVAIGYFKATPTNSRIDTPHAFIINPGGQIVDDWPEGRSGTILAAKGGVAAALQAVMAAHK